MSLPPLLIAMRVMMPEEEDQDDGDDDNGRARRCPVGAWCWGDIRERC